MIFDSAIDVSGQIPADDARQSDKKAYSELLSRQLAFDVALELRLRRIFAGISPRLPADAAEAMEVRRPSAGVRKKSKSSEAPEKYFLGGFGRKKLDVSLANEQDGLLFALSVKTITSRDARTRNYNKNFKNRFGDLCAEATSVHMRSPYTYMAAIFAMPTAAAFDSTTKRGSTAERALRYLRSISGRASHEQSPEKFESVVFLLFDPIDSSGHHAQHQVNEAQFDGITALSGSGRYRLFDVTSMKEITDEELCAHLEKGFLERNPFLDEG
jgi:hypothetical protein